MKKNKTIRVSDAIPEMPLSFDRTVERTLASVCTEKQQEKSTEAAQEKSERKWEQTPGVRRKKSGRLVKQIGTVAVAASLVFCVVAVGAVALWPRNTKKAPAATAGSNDVIVQASPTAAVETVMDATCVTETVLLPDYTDSNTGNGYDFYAALREQNGIPAFSEAEFSWIKDLLCEVDYLDLNDRTLDYETVFTAKQSVRDAFSASPINGDDRLISVEADAPWLILDDTERMPGEANMSSSGAQYFYSDTYANRGDMDLWQLSVAQQYNFLDGFMEMAEKSRTLAMQTTYRVYDCRYLDRNKDASLVGVIVQTVEVDMQKLMTIDAEYRTELVLSGTHTLTCIKQESNGEYSYSNNELNFDGLVLNETVQYRPTGLYVTLSVKELPQGWEKSYGTSLLYPSAFVAENAYGLSAELTWGVGEGQMKMRPVGSRVPWACPKDTIVFVFPVTSSDDGLRIYGAELHLWLRATGEKNAQELCRIALPLPENGGQNAATPNPTPVPTPEPTAEPVVTEQPTPEPGAIPSVFRFWEYDEQNGYSEAPEKGVLFTCDFDGNGTEDEIAYERHGQYLAISVGKKSVELSYGAGLEQAILMDLDPASERLNLLVVYNTGSEDYETAELHMENGKFVRGPVIYAYCTCDGGTVHGSVTQTDILGTRDGARNYHGEDLTPDSEWFDCDVIPDEIQSASDREHLIEWGKLLHLVRDLPCTINGEDAVIPAGTYVYMTRWHESRTLAEIRTEDGTLTALVTVEGADPDDPEQYGYLIGGELQDTYFDNIFYAD